MTPERIAELRIEALNAKYAGKEFTIPASETMEILNIAMNQFVPRVTPEMWKALGRVEAVTKEYTQHECHHCGAGVTVHKPEPVTMSDEQIIELATVEGLWEKRNGVWHAFGGENDLLRYTRAVIAIIGDQS